MVNADNFFIARGVKRRFDIQSHPVDQGQYFGQMFRPVTAGMQTDFVAQSFDLTHLVGQTILHQRFAAAEHHRVQNAAAFLQKLDKLRPQKTALPADFLQCRIIAERTPPRAPLHKYDSSQFSRKIDGAESFNTADD